MKTLTNNAKSFLVNHTSIKDQSTSFRSNCTIKNSLPLTTRNENKLFIRLDLLTTESINQIFMYIPKNSFFNSFKSINNNRLLPKITSVLSNKKCSSSFKINSMSKL